MGKPGSSTQQTLEFVERYQALFNQDPNSKVFAPLAEGYRKLGFLKQAQDIARKGVALHPAFASGHLALARVLMDLNEKDSAVQHLEKVVELSPENLLAHRLMAQGRMELGQPKEALKSFKMLLFLNPRDELAAAQVKKFESLTADDFSEDVFAANTLASPTAPSPRPVKTFLNTHERQRFLERTVSLVDALLVRSDFERALQLLKDAELAIGAHPEIMRRAQFITRRGAGEPEAAGGGARSTPSADEWQLQQHPASSAVRPTSRETLYADPVVQKATSVSRKIEKLERLLARVESRKLPAEG